MNKGLRTVIIIAVSMLVIIGAVLLVFKPRISCWYSSREATQDYFFNLKDAGLTTELSNKAVNEQYRQDCYAEKGLSI